MTEAPMLEVTTVNAISHFRANFKTGDTVWCAAFAIDPQASGIVVDDEPKECTVEGARLVPLDGSTPRSSYKHIVGASEERVRDAYAEAVLDALDQAAARQYAVNRIVLECAHKFAKLNMETKG